MEKKKLLELINKFRKVAGYKKNIQKSNVFLYSVNDRNTKEIEKTTSFTIASTKIKYLNINVTK